MAFGKQAIIENLEDQLATERRVNQELQRQLDVTGQVGRIATAVEAELGHIEEMGVTGEEAERAAQVSVFSTERAKLVKDTTEDLIDTHRDRYVADLCIKEGPAIRMNVDAELKANGTYAHIEAEERSKLEQNLRESLIAEQREKIVADLQSDESQAGLRFKVAEEVRGSGEMEKYTDTQRAQLEEKWAEEARAEVRQEIDDAETAREIEFKTAYKAQQIQTQRWKSYRESKRADLERNWSGVTSVELAAGIDDEELTLLLEQKARDAASELEKELHGKKLLGEFEGRGIDAGSLEQGTRLDILLGSIVDIKVKEDYRDYNGYPAQRDVTKPGVKCLRKLTLTACGEGRFTVDRDSLSESKSVYEQDNSIDSGVIVVIGRKVSENGDQKLEQRLVAGIPLQYDDDTTTPNFVDTKVPIADVVINGVSARGLSTVQMV